MADGTNTHNRVAANFVGAMFGRLRGSGCGAFGSDVKVRIPRRTHTRFYYPDGTVVCDSNGPGDTFQDRPVVVLEVLSPSTRRLDEGEKLEAYLDLSSVRVVLLAEPDRVEVTAYRRSERTGGVDPERYLSIGETVPLPEVNAELPLADLYDGVELRASS